MTSLFNASFKSDSLIKPPLAQLIITRTTPHRSYAFFIEHIFCLIVEFCM